MIIFIWNFILYYVKIYRPIDLEYSGKSSFPVATPYFYY